MRCLRVYTCTVLLSSRNTHAEMVGGTGSVTGPTHAMAIYLEMFHSHSTRYGQRCNLSQTRDGTVVHFYLYRRKCLEDVSMRKLAIFGEKKTIPPFRFITGTDFVSSLGQPAEYPGLKEKPNGCMKDKAGHARQVRHDSYWRCSRHHLPLQVTDTSAINMFLNDEAFANIVLGGNYFKILRYSREN